MTYEGNVGFVGIGARFFFRQSRPFKFPNLPHSHLVDKRFLRFLCHRFALIAIQFRTSPKLAPNMSRPLSPLFLSSVCGKAAARDRPENRFLEESRQRIGGSIGLRDRRRRMSRGFPAILRDENWCSQSLDFLGEETVASPAHVQYTTWETLESEFTILPATFFRTEREEEQFLPLSFFCKFRFLYR